MAKISRHGGATYAEGEVPPADEPHPEATGAGTEPEAVEEAPAEVEPDANPEVEDVEPKGLYLPARHAKREEWEHALVKAGLHEPYAMVLTKDALVDLGRALADGTTRLDDYGLPTGAYDPGDDWREPEPEVTVGDTGEPEPDDSDLNTGA
jgi:hypothetical protein